MLKDSYLQNFTYRTKEEDQDYFIDSEHWTVTKKICMKQIELLQWVSDL